VLVGHDNHSVTLYRANEAISAFTMAAMSTFSGKTGEPNGSKFKSATLNKFRSNSFITRSSDYVKLWKFTNDLTLYELPVTIQVEYQIIMVTYRLEIETSVNCLRMVAT
jgi:hypothetical protein